MLAYFSLFTPVITALNAGYYGYLGSSACGHCFHGKLKRISGIINLDQSNHAAMDDQAELTLTDAKRSSIHLDKKLRQPA